MNKIIISLVILVSMFQWVNADNQKSMVLKNDKKITNSKYIEQTKIDSGISVDYTITRTITAIKEQIEIIKTIKEIRLDKPRNEIKNIKQQTKILIINWYKATGYKMNQNIYLVKIPIVDWNKLTSCKEIRQIYPKYVFTELWDTDDNPKIKKSKKKSRKIKRKTRKSVRLVYNKFNLKTTNGQRLDLSFKYRKRK